MGLFNRRASKKRDRAEARLLDAQRRAYEHQQRLQAAQERAARWEFHNQQQRAAWAAYYAQQQALQQGQQPRDQRG
jgi:hypothetical protein